MNITFDVYGDKQMKFALDKRADAIKNFKPAFERIEEDFREVERELFGSEGSKGGSGAWKPLVPWYSEWKSKQGKGETILVFNGDLYSSLVNKNDSNSITVIEAQQLRLGTKDPKAMRHYKGGGKLPSRKPIDLSSNDKKRWLKIIQRWVMNVIHGKVNE